MGGALPPAFFRLAVYALPLTDTLPLSPQQQRTKKTKKRTFAPGQVCDTPATGHGLFSKTQRVSSDAFPETVDKKEGAGCRTSPLSWLDATTRDRKVGVCLCV